MARSPVDVDQGYVYFLFFCLYFHKKKNGVKYDHTGIMQKFNAIWAEEIRPRVKFILLKSRPQEGFGVKRTTSGKSVINVTY